MLEPSIIFVLIIVASFFAYKHHSLTGTGAYAALIVGMAVFIGFGVKGLFLLGVFFATSSFWSKFKSLEKRNIEEKLAKGSIRDWRQVAANGGAAALFSIIYFLNNDDLWLIAFAVSIASANSDTWASEIGTLSKRKPFSIRTFQRMEKGTSGAVSLLGSCAAILGAFLISLFCFWLFQLNVSDSIIIFLFGFIGNMIDTLFGAFYQQLYVCKKCGIETEKQFHCHLETQRIKGFRFVDNDMVNFLSGLLAAFAALGIVYIIN